MPSGTDEGWDWWDPSQLVPLSTLSLEGFGEVSSLARRFRDDLIVNDIGQSCVSRIAARALFTERAARRATRLVAEGIAAEGGGE